MPKNAKSRLPRPGSVLDEGVLDLQACWNEYVCLEDLHVPAVRCCADSPSARFEMYPSKQRVVQQAPRPGDFPLLARSAEDCAQVEEQQPQTREEDNDAAWAGWVEIVDQADSRCGNNATGHSMPRSLATRDLVDRAWRDVLMQPAPRSVAAAVAAAAQWVKVDARDAHADCGGTGDAQGGGGGVPQAAPVVARALRPRDQTTWHAMKAAGERKVSMRMRKDTKLRKNRRHLSA